MYSHVTLGSNDLARAEPFYDAVMATLGDLCESVIKRDLGIKDMSQVIPGHGGLMDRLDSLLATVAPIWLILYYLVY